MVADTGYRRGEDLDQTGCRLLGEVVRDPGAELVGVGPGVNCGGSERGRAASTITALGALCTRS